MLGDNGGRAPCKKSVSNTTHTYARAQISYLYLLSLVRAPNALHVAFIWAFVGRWHVASWAWGADNLRRFLDFHGT